MRSVDSNDDESYERGELSTDGGAAEAPFHTFSDVEVSSWDRLRFAYREFVYAPFKIIWRDGRARFGLTIVLMYVLIGIFGPKLLEPTNVMDGPRLVGAFETSAHLFGTDPQGKDLLTQTVYSTTPILQMLVAGSTFSVTFGTSVGVVAGYKGGKVDSILSTITDIFINIPGLPLVIVLAALLAPENPYVVGIILSVAAWAGLARNIRSQVLSLRTDSYVEAARTIGVSSPKIMVRHILPELMPYISINAVNHGRRVIYAAVGLYFIGVLPINDDNWGVMLNRAYNGGALYNPEMFHWLWLPLLSIVLLSLGMILLAQSFDRVFNPRVRARHTTDEASEQHTTTR